MRHSLRIALVAPLWTSVPPVAYGGIERHLHLLVEELARRGHSVTLFASGDSRTSATLRSVVPSGVAGWMDRGEAFFYEHYQNANLAQALEASDAYDVVHLHLGCAAIPLAELARCPVLHSVHTGLTPDDLWILERYPKTRLTALSSRQVADVPEERRTRIDIVPYGYDFDSCVAMQDPSGPLVFLGRMAPHKAPDAAIAIARAAGRKIRLAGAPVTREDRTWFDREIEPLVDGRDVVWLGTVDDTTKNELFRGAAAFLFPIRWEEPFGLVMLESMARGVPVLATPRGSVPEVVEPGVTGFIAEERDELAGCAEAAAGLDRETVRERAKKRFSVTSMVDAYEAAYVKTRDGD